MYNSDTGNLNSGQLVFGPELKSKIMIFISNEAEKFEGIQNFCLMEKNWLLQIFLKFFLNFSNLLTVQHSHL